MLTRLLDQSIGLRQHCSALCTQFQNAALAEAEGERLRCARRVGIHSPTAWSSAVRARVHASVLGMKYYLPELVFYGGGVSLYAVSSHARCPFSC